ncbi:MAG: hypothetical protein B6244_09545 [Candidatus Cloacimonetes bacterium 4572_55]|nr:MAG: hypothetical protein B6244_09545 [Candidatus Cloacimonetes bacterium 4572_55]
MIDSIKFLVIEDCEDDILQLTRYLRSHYRDIEYKVVGNQYDMREALETESWDLVISNYFLSNFSGLNALNLLKEMKIDLPFIVVSDSIGEEAAVELMRSGAHDYILKDNLVRLTSVIERELHEAEVRQVQRHITEKLNKLSLVVEQSPNIILITDIYGYIDYINPRFIEITGYFPDEVIGKTLTILKPGHTPIKEFIRQWEIIQNSGEWRGEIEYKKNDGDTYAASAVISPIWNERNEITHYLTVAEDTTERQKSEKIKKATYKISEAANATHNLKEFFELIHAIVDNLMTADNFYIALYDLDTKSLTLPYMVDQFDTNSSFFHRMDKGLTGYVLQTEQPLLANPKTIKELERTGKVILIGAPALYWLGVPLKTRNKTIGVLSVQSYSPDIRFDEEDKNILIFIANQVAMVIERKRVAEKLQASEERYALAALSANDGLWDWDLGTNDVYYFSRWKSMLGYREDEVKPELDEWYSRIHEDDIKKVKSQIDAHLKGDTEHFESEHRMRHKDGTYRWMLNRGLAIRNEDGKVYRMAGSQTDITKRKRAEGQLLHDAFHDMLTGLPNRALFMDRMGLAFYRYKRVESYQFGVIFLDIDHFKNINDSLGHVIGDNLLIEIAYRLESSLRLGDTLARMGGDEFGILVANASDINEALLVADRVQNELRMPFVFENHEVFVTASIGIAYSQTGYDRPEDLLRDVDTAMYRAKALGRDRHVIFDEAMHEHAVKRLQTETDLRRAIERKEFQVYYQPIISLKNNCISGFEALIRWQHPKLGMIFPKNFITIAEETGLIVPIDLWVLEEACRQTKRWQMQYQKEPPLFISVNLSGKQFMQSDLVDQIDRIRRESDLNAHSLKLEITESAVMENAKSASMMLSRLRDMNFQLCIDDFGTGYSSLSYLHSFPVNTLKIDQSFVMRIEKNGQNSEIVKTIILLANNMNMDVVAEGVETKEHLKLLKELQCEYAQGFYFSRPLNAENAEKIFLKQTPKWDY